MQTEKVYKSFFETINWIKFLKLVVPVLAIMILAVLNNPSIGWWMPPVITLLWAFAMLLKAYSMFRMNKNLKRELTSNEIRLKKLKRIKRKNFINI